VDLKKTACDGVECIDLAQGNLKWQALANMVMNFGFHENQEMY